MGQVGMTDRAKHEAMFDAMRIEALNAPTALSHQIVDILNQYHFFTADRMILIDAAEMLADIGEGYEA